MASYMNIMRQRLGEKQEQLRVLQAEIELIQSMLAEASGQPDPSFPKPRARRSSVKTYVLELLEQVGTNGLNAGIAVEMAASEKRELDRNSVSSLLSRLKHDETVEYDGDRYRLSSVTKAQRNAEANKRTMPGMPDNIHPHPASGRSV